MIKKNTGGPAFPTTKTHYNQGMSEVIYEPGMTLRQYYKAQALMGVLSNSALMQAVCDENENGSEVAVTVANLTGLYADKMIEEDEE